MVTTHKNADGSLFVEIVFDAEDAPESERNRPRIGRPVRPRFDEPTSPDADKPNETKPE